MKLTVLTSQQDRSWSNVHYSMVITYDNSPFSYISFLGVTHNRTNEPIEVPSETETTLPPQQPVPANTPAEFSGDQPTSPKK